MSNKGFEVASGCANASYLVPSNNVAAFQVSSTAGAILGIDIQNNSSTIAYLKIYDAASGTVAGSGTPKARFMLPANTSYSLDFGTPDQGIAIAFGIAAVVTTGIVDTDKSAPIGSEYIVNIRYKGSPSGSVPQSIVTGAIIQDAGGYILQDSGGKILR
jgi:hypothetical protein